MPPTPRSHQDPGGGMAGWGFQPRSPATPEKGPDWVRSQPAAWPCMAGTCREPVPSSGVVCPAAWSGGPCRPRGSEHPHCGPGTLPCAAPRPSRLGVVDTRQRPCPVTSISSPPQVPCRTSGGLPGPTAWAPMASGCSRSPWKGLWPLGVLRVCPGPVCAPRLLGVRLGCSRSFQPARLPLAGVSTCSRWAGRWPHRSGLSWPPRGSG